MAIRNIRTEGDEILRKKCKEVTGLTPKITTLIEDMVETMYDANGVGLAAPQVGILKRIVVIDAGEGLHVLINPVILETDGEQTGGEGCLSVPGKTATVTRPMKEFVLEGTELLARAICHECDHLEGILYVDKAESPIMDSEAYYEKYKEENE